MPAVSPATPVGQTANTESGRDSAVEPNLSVWAHPNLALLYEGARGGTRPAGRPAESATEVRGAS